MRIPMLLSLALACASAQRPGDLRRPDRQGMLRPGDPAPEFALKVRGAERIVRLASFRRQKPVALVFGSYT